MTDYFPRQDSPKSADSKYKIINGNTNTIAHQDAQPLVTASNFCDDPVVYLRIGELTDDFGGDRGQNDTPDGDSWLLELIVQNSIYRKL